MTRNEAIEKLGALGGRRNMIIGAGAGCLSVVVGLLLACGLLFGWVGNTVKSMAANNPPITVAEAYGQVGYTQRDVAESTCGVGQEVRGTVYADGSWAGWQCVEVGR